MESQDLTLHDISLGSSASFDRTFEEKDVLDFAKCSGDTNPLHLDDEYAATTVFKKRLVHGMLLGSLCSKFVGVYIPGKRCLYISQSLMFKKPVFIGDTIRVTGTVVAKSEVTKMITIAFVFTRNDDIVVTGEARAQVL